MKKLHAVLLCTFFLFLSSLTLAQAMGSRYRTLKISSNVPLSGVNWNKGIIFQGTNSEYAEEITLLAETGDLLGFAGENLALAYRYRRSDGQRLRFRFDTDPPHKTYLNDRLISLAVDEDPAVLEWSQNSKAREYRSLRSIYCSAEAANIPILKKIAKTKPRIGLFIESGDADASGAEQIISLFRPSWLALGEDIEIDEEVLPRLRRLELLFIGAENLVYLGKLPQVKTLIIQNYRSGDIPFSDLNAHLRSLTLYYHSLPSLSELSRFKNLQNLHLCGCEIQNIDSLPSFTRLRGVGFACNSLENASALQKLSALKWITFPPNTSQEEFIRGIAANPRLQVVGILDCEKLQDLSALERLPRLKGLILSLPEEGLPVLPVLPRLEVLLVGLYKPPSDPQTAQLQAAFPNAQVVRGGYEGYCLGSGWILLLVPLAASFTAIAHRRKKGSGG